jgi:hypothetical protein
MSKVDAQRAMREAKYARAHASGPNRREAATVREVSTPPAALSPSNEAVRAGTVVAAPEGDAPCGHRSMNGRVCTRDAGHSEKSHRYS